MNRLSLVTVNRPTPSFRFLVLDSADVRAPDSVDDVPRCRVEDEGVQLVPTGEGEGEEGRAAEKLHVVHLRPARTPRLSQITGFQECGI